jgi:hypothetical protein
MRQNARQSRYVAEEKQRGAGIAAQNWTRLTQTVFSVILMPAEAGASQF